MGRVEGRDDKGGRVKESECPCCKRPWARGVERRKYGRWCYTTCQVGPGLAGGHCASDADVSPLCGAPGTNVTLYRPLQLRIKKKKNGRKNKVRDAFRSNNYDRRGNDGVPCPAGRGAQ